MSKMCFFVWTSVTFLPLVQAVVFPSVGVGTTARKVSYAEVKLVDNMTTWIQNKTIKTYVSAHLLFCPNQDMCFGDQFKRNYTYKLKVRSCSYCACDDECHRKKNCCPWRLYVQNPTSTPSFITYKDHNFLTPSRYNNISLECVKPTINSNIQSGNDIRDYFMISKCPTEFTNKELTKKCQRFHQETDIRAFQPVTSLHSNETFKNLDCALCNAELPDSLVVWEARVICKMPADVFQLINSVEELQKLIFAPLPACSIEFNPPPFVHEDSTNFCISEASYIKKCNYTGEWGVHSASIEKGCSMDYVDPYTHCKGILVGKHDIYKNIFCAMCNVKNWTSELVTECIEQFYLDSDHLASFSALLDLRGIYKEEEANQRCAMYDPLLKTCHQIVCGAGLKYENSECVPIHKQINQQMYEINLILKAQKFSNNIPLLKYQVDILNSIRTDQEIWKHLCFAQTMTSDPEVLLNTSAISSLMIYIKLSVSEFHDLKEFVKKMIEKFKFTKRLHNNLDIEMISKSFKSTYSPSVPGHSAHGESVPEYFLDPVSQGVTYGVFKLKGKNKTLKCTDNVSPVITTIAPVTICPRIVIHKSQTKVVVSNLSLCFDDFGFCLESRYFKESPNRSQVEVCLSQYLERASISSASLTEEKILSVVCLSLSSVGCLGSVVTFVIFDEVKHLHGFNMVGLSITLFLANTVYTFSRVSSLYPTLCVTVGALSHFLWLSVVVWMTVSSLPIFRALTYLTAKKTESQRVGRRFMLNIFCSFLIPILMVSTNILISVFVYQDSSYGYSMFTCYISRTDMIIYTFAIPLAVMVTLNVFMFILTVREINLKRVSPVVKQGTDRQMLLIFCRLSTITGGAWVFGFLHQFFQIQLFSYLQILITGSQGLFIFLAFGVRLISRKSIKRDPTTNSTLTS